MRLITIKKDYGNMTAVEGKLKSARRMWTVTGELEIYLSGSYKGIELDQARALAFAVCEEMHIPLMSLRQVDTGHYAGPKVRVDLYRKRLF